MSGEGLAPTLACVWLPTLAASTQAEREQVALRLEHLSPVIEVDEDVPGRLWLDLCGLGTLFAPQQLPNGPLAHVLPWARALARALAGTELPAHCVLGFRRWSLWALCMQVSWTGSTLRWGTWDCTTLTAPPLWTPEDERQAALGVTLRALPVTERAKGCARQLRLETLGELLSLRTSSVAQRLGDELLGWRTAMSAAEAPLRPLKKPPPPRAAQTFEPPTLQHEVVLFAAKRLLPALRAQVAARHLRMGAVIMELTLEGPGKLVGKPPPQKLLRRLELAHTHVTERALLNLLRLYVTGLTLPAAVTEVVLTAETTAPTSEQQSLWMHTKTRNVEQANEALAQLRAALGDRAVVVATLVPAHIPQQAFHWQPAPRLKPLSVQRRRSLPPAPPAQKAQQSATGFAGGFAPRPLVRRLFAVPKRLHEARLGGAQLPLAPPPLHFAEAANSDAACAPDLAVPLGPTPRVQGPYMLSAQWWQRPQDSDEYYVRDGAGAWLIVAFDRQARRWWWRGYVD